VSALASSQQLGYYSASFRIIEVAAPVSGLLVGAAFPIFARAAREDHERLGYALGRVFEVALIVGAGIAVCTIVGASLAIRIIGGSNFEPAAPVLAWQGVALGAGFVSAVWSNGLLGLGLFRQILRLNLAALIAGTAIIAGLVLADGARGAAIGTVIAEVAAASASAMLVVRGRPALAPSLRVVPRVALAAGLGLIPLAFAGWPDIARLAMTTVLYLGTLVITRALPSELGALIPAWAQRSRRRRA
jgi:O-antigen/teichoic acid export membrane protein